MICISPKTIISLIDPQRPDYDNLPDLNGEVSREGFKSATRNTTDSLHMLGGTDIHIPLIDLLF